MKNLQKRVDEFSESEEFATYATKWIPRNYDCFYDAHTLGFNLDWVNRKLCECDYVNLYTGLIRGLQKEIKEGNYNWQDTEYLKKRLNDNKEKFFKELSNLIRDYCVRE